MGRINDSPGFGLALIDAGEFGDRQAVRQFERGFETLRQALAHIVPHDDAVDHDVDVVLELLVQFGRVFQIVKFAVDFHPGEAAFQEVRELFAILTLAASDDWREQVEPCPLRQGERSVDHLGDGLAFDRQAGCRRDRNADPRP